MVAATVVPPLAFFTTAFAAAVRAAVDVFAPEPAGLAALSKRVKESFDPKGVLNPGRMWAGV